MFIHWETHIEGWSHKNGNKQAKMLRVADSGGWENGKLLFSFLGFTGFAFFKKIFPQIKIERALIECADWTAGLNIWVHCGSMWLPDPSRVKGPRVSSSILSSSLFKVRPMLISFSLMALNNQPRPLSWTPDSYISNCPLTSAGECPKRHLKFQMSKIELLIPLFSKAKNKKTTQHLHLSKWQLCFQRLRPKTLESSFLSSFSLTPHTELIRKSCWFYFQNTPRIWPLLYTSSTTSHRHLLPALLESLLMGFPISYLYLFHVIIPAARKTLLSQTLGSYKWKWKCSLLSCVLLLATPWTSAYQASLSKEFSRQEYSGGLPFPFPGAIPNPGIEPDSLLSEPPGKPR